MSVLSWCSEQALAEKVMRIHLVTDGGCVHALRSVSPDRSKPLRSFDTCSFCISKRCFDEGDAE